MEILKLSEIILNCLKYEENEGLIDFVFVKKVDGKIKANSEAIILSLTEDDADMNIKDIIATKCPGYDYFLELFIIQEVFEDIQHQEEYKLDEEKIKRIIYYAEFDA